MLTIVQIGLFNIDFKVLMWLKEKININHDRLRTEAITIFF